MALALSVALSLTSTLTASSAETLIKISEDPYTNTTSNHKTEVEPDTFAFGNTIVATFQVGRFFNGGASNIGFATSTDAGKTWKHDFLPSSTVYATPAGPYARASDPSVAYDANHKVWMISWLGIKSPTGPVDVLVSRSIDGGVTFGSPVVVNASGRFNDKNWTVCDDTSTSPHYGNCYTEFDDNTRLNRFQMSTSKDGGETWGAAKTNPDHSCVIAGQPVVQPNGTVIVPIDDCFETAILSIRSTDGGETWSRPALVAEIINNGNPPVPAAGSPGVRTPDLPSAEIDGSGRVYLVWSDCRFEDFCNAPIGTNDILLTSSADGITWTLPKRIPTAKLGTGADFFIPGLAVDRSTSGSSAHLGLAYHYYPSSNCTLSTCALNVGFISSTDGGNHWSSPEQIAGPMTLTWLPLTTQGLMFGDYISTSIVPGAANAFPVFALAKAPTPPPNCSNLSTGDPGQGCDVAMYTIGEDVVKVTGGTNESSDAESALTVPAPAAPLAPAAPAAKSRLPALASAF